MEEVGGERGRKGENFDSILASYVNHVCNIQKDYASCLVIFDGYLNVSTKDHARGTLLHLLRSKQRELQFSTVTKK